MRERYDVRVAGDIYRGGDGDYLAGSDERRAEELNGYLRDPDVRAIFVARGGYGSMRIVDDLDADALRADPKPIVGFSDVTVLLAWSLQHAGVRPIHGPVVTQLGDVSAADREHLFRLLEDATAPGPVEAALTSIGVESGPIEAPLVGGNLTLIAHLAGTRYELDLRGAIALVEDVDEPPYAIDRLLTRIAMAKAFSGCRAVAAGALLRCEGKGDAHAVLDERLRAFDLPGVRGLPIGHADRNLAVPFGGMCALDPTAKTLAILDPAVG